MPMPPASGNVAFQVADAMALPFPDGSFDVVHAHQVLQHVPDPGGRAAGDAPGVSSRRAGRGPRLRLRRDDLVPSRDPALTDWLALYELTARASGGEPDAGRRLLAWAHAAGLRDVTATASAWCFATATTGHGGVACGPTGPPSRPSPSRRWLTAWRTRAGLERIAAAWRQWSAEPDGWFAILHGEILCRA